VSGAPLILMADRSLARRLEEADGQAGVQFARTLAGLRPGTAATADRVAGGYVVYAGVGSPLTLAVGIGMDGAVSEADLDRVEAFYRSRGVMTEMEVCPLADRSLYEMLGARGYRVIEFDNVLVRDLRRSEPPPRAPRGAGTPQRAPRRAEALQRAPKGVEVAAAEAGEIEEWARSVARGFAAPDEIPPVLLGLFGTLGRIPGAAPFLARVEGSIAGGGLVTIDQGVARLSGTSTLPEFRGRGVHRALLQARLEFAAAAGADLATTRALPGSVSQRNAERQEFRVAYTRAKMALDPRGGSEMLLHY
jgi:GNAT superfamily N-acetyltransferase